MPIDGIDRFDEAIERTEGATRDSLRQPLRWARGAESRNLATLMTVLGEARQILLVWVPGEKAALVSIWNDNGPYISLWRSVFVRRAWQQIKPIKNVIGKPMGQGNTVAAPSDELLAVISTAYEQAAEKEPECDRRSYYVSIGDGPRRKSDDLCK